jgi:hypothetical protein
MVEREILLHPWLPNNPTQEPGSQGDIVMAEDGLETKGEFYAGWPRQTSFWMPQFDDLANMEKARFPKADAIGLFDVIHGIDNFLVVPIAIGNQPDDISLGFHGVLCQLFLKSVLGNSTLTVANAFSMRGAMASAGVSPSTTSSV